MYIVALFGTIVVFIAHYIGLLGAYGSVYGYDNLVHFLGGVSIGFCIILFTKIFPRFVIFRRLGMLLIGVIIIGILWEVFEYIADIAVMPGQAYWPDTIKDLILDTIGGVGAWFIARKKI